MLLTWASLCRQGLKQLSQQRVHRLSIAYRKNLHGTQDRGGDKDNTSAVQVFVSTSFPCFTQFIRICGFFRILASVKFDFNHRPSSTKFSYCGCFQLSIVTTTF